MDDYSLFSDHFIHDSKSLRNGLNKLRVDRKFCDSTIRTKDGCFPVHKNVLISLCAYFDTSFGDDKNDIELNTVNSEVFELILEYIYTGSIKKRNFDFNKAIKMYEAASFLGMDALKNLIGEYLITSVDTRSCLTLWRTGAKLMNEKLQNKSVEFIKRNCLEFLNSHLLELSENEIEKILNFENINISREELLSKLLRWIKEEFNDRSIYIADFMEYINSKEISTDYINKNIVTDQILYQNQTILQFCLKVTRYRSAENNPIQKLNENSCLPKYEGNPLLPVPSYFNKVDTKENEKQIVKLFDGKTENKPIQKLNENSCLPKYEANPLLPDPSYFNKIDKSNNVKQIVKLLVSKMEYTPIQHVNENICKYSATDIATDEEQEIVSEKIEEKPLVKNVEINIKTSTIITEKELEPKIVEERKELKKVSEKVEEKPFIIDVEDNVQTSKTIIIKKETEPLIVEGSKEAKKVYAGLPIDKSSDVWMEIMDEQMVFSDEDEESF